MATLVDLRMEAINQVVQFEKEIQRLYENKKFFVGATFNFPQKYYTAWVNTNQCQNLLSELLSTLSLSYSDNGTFIVIG